MKIVELKCPNCGAKLVKIDKKNANCNHCGSVFLIKKVQKEQRNTQTANTKSAGTVIGILGLAFLVLSGIMLIRIEEKWEETTPVEESRVEEEKQQWSAFFEAFLEEVYGLPVSKINKNRLSEMTHLKIYWENECRIAEYRMKNGALNRIVLSGELEIDYGDAGDLKGLESLDIAQNDFAEGELTELEHLTEIWSGNTPEELSAIVCEPENIRVMGCYWTSTIAQIERFVNLEHLYVSSPGLSESLTDISALGALERLKKLELMDCDRIEDFGVLHSLAGLEELTIDSEVLKEISFIERMDSLRRLKLEDTIVMEVSALEGRTSIKELALIDNYDVTSYDSLTSLSGLEKLELELCSVSYMPDASNWKELTSLTVRGADDISFLKELPQLKNLYLSGCDCSANESLSTLQNLETLKLSGMYGNIANLDVLMRMSALKNLDISKMQLYGNVQNIFGIPTLEDLNISDCSFGFDFEAMPENVNLKCLNMNRIELWDNIQVAYDGMITYLDYDEVLVKDHIAFLNNFPNLEELYMQENKLTEVEFTSNLPYLKRLDITGNYVTDLRPLGNLEHLEIVWCGENPISQGLDIGEEVLVVSDSETEDYLY